MTLALLLAIATPQAAALPTKKVSFSCEVSSAAIAVKAFSKSTGIPMAVDPSSASEVVFLKVNNLPLNEVMDSLARVTASEWTRDGTTYRLTRSLKAVEAERKSVDARRLKYLQQWRDRMLKSLATSYDPATVNKQVKEFSDLRAAAQKRELTATETRRFSQLRDAAPTVRALARCLKQIDLADIIEAADVAVFASEPYGRQLPFKQTPRATWEKLLDEKKVWSEALAAQPDDSLELYYYGRQDWGRLDDGPLATGPSGAPSKVVLSIRRFGVDGFTVKFHVLNRDNGEVLYLHIDDEMHPGYVEPKPGKPYPEVTEGVDWMVST